MSAKNISSFSVALMQELIGNACNYYGSENWDSDLFGTHKQSLRANILSKINSLVNGRFVILPRNINIDGQIERIIQDFGEGLSSLYDLLEDEYSKTMLVKVITYRILGYRKVKLPLNTLDYWSKRKNVLSLIKGSDTVKTKFMNWALNYFELARIGFPLKLYYVPIGVLTTFILKHYEYGKTKPAIKVQKGDYVIDAGGCWGDTALYFAHEIGRDGKVYTFEFVPSNVEIMMRNFGLNPELSGQIEIIRNPLWSESDLSLFCSDNGPGSKVKDEKTSEDDIQISTLSIDDFVKRHSVPRVDFIKMDIEGAELPALKGAVKTIKRYKPKLAVSLYHSLKDFVDIPDFLSSLELGYKFYIDHFTIHQYETVLFAIPA